VLNKSATFRADNGPVTITNDKCLRLHIIPLTDAELDSNGNPTRPFAVTPQEFADLLGRVNWSFEGTGIRLVFDYVALPNRIDLLNQVNGSFVAHELGHYLGWYHTFPGWDGHDPVFQRFKNPDGSNATPPSPEAADQAVIDYLAANGDTINALDGDLLSDTPPDPTPLLYQVHNNQAICAQRQIVVSGTRNGQPVSFTFAPDPNNVMSYYGGCGPAGAPPPPRSFSPQQVQRMHQTLQHPSRRHLLLE
jgi:hypothetical protein